MQAGIIGCAKAHGWLAYHTYDSRRSPEGFPDLILIRWARLVVMELKVRKNIVTPAQQAWLVAFAGVGAEVYVVRGTRPGPLEIDYDEALRILGVEVA